MGQPNFWDNPEKAQQIIGQMKPLNGLLKPYEDLMPRLASNIETLAELAAEDAELEAELERELKRRFEKQVGDFLRCARPCSAARRTPVTPFLRIQARHRRHLEACDLKHEMLARDVRALG